MIHLARPAGPAAASPCSLDKLTHISAALRSHAGQRSTDVRRRVDKALRELRKQGAAINVNIVALRAGVTHKTVYHHRNLMARIRAHTQLAPAAPDDRGSNNFTAALCIALSAKDNEIAQR